MNGLVRRRRVAPAVRPDFCDHLTLGASAVADEHILARPQLGDPEPPQRLHVHEDIGRAVPGGEETEAANAVAPLQLKPLELAGRLHDDMRAWCRHLCRMPR